MKIKDARAIKSRQALLDASMKLLLQNPSASLSELAAFAGVGRATLYRHFNTREILIQELVKETLLVTDQAMTPLKAQGLTGRVAIEATLRTIMPLADRYHFLLSLWYIAADDKSVMKIYNRQLDELYGLVEQAKQEGNIKKQLSVAWIVTVIDTLIYAGWWFISQGEMTTKQATDHVIDSLFNGVKA